MANYNIDIAVALKGAKELLKLKKDVKAITQEVNGFNKALAENANKFPKTINSLTEELNKAKTALRNAAVGTTSFNNAAQVFLKTQKELNKELAEEARILKQIETRRFGVAQSSSGNRVRRNVAESRRSRISSKFKTLDIPTPDKLGQVAIRTNVLRNIRESQQSRIGEGFRSLSLSGQSVDVEAKIKQNLENRKRTEKEVAKIRERLIKKEQKLLLTRKKILKEEITTRTRILRQNQFGNVNPGSGGFRAFSQRADEITANAAATRNRPGFGQMVRSQFAQGGMFAGTRNQRIRGATSSALIGGGFPLLFGQGGLGAALGGIGGGIGGALGGGFGFGLSIAGTALATRIQETIDFRKAVDKLNVSIQATGGTSTFTAKQVAEFAKSLGMTKDEALEALKAFKQFEASARITLLKTFGSEGTFDIFAGLKNNVSIISALPGLSKELGINQAISALETLKSKDATAAQDQLLGNIISKNKEIIKQESKKVGFFENLNPFRGKFKLNDPSKGIQGGGGFMTVEELEEFKAKNAGAEFDSLIVQAKERLRLQRQFNEELERQAIIKAPVDELNRLLDPLTQIDELGKSIGNSFSESFKGIVKGSMTAQEALRNLFMRTADHFLDMAAQILAAQIRSGIFGLFGSFLNPTFGTGMGSNPAGMRQQGVGVTANRLNRHVVGHSSIQPKANGGPVMAGGGYLVGERGPELFSPGVSGTITPNHALGGSTNVVVNVDASGSSVEGDEQQGRELGRLISVAVQSELLQQKRPGGLLA